MIPMIFNIPAPAISYASSWGKFLFFRLLDRNFSISKVYNTKQDSAVDFCDTRYGAEIDLFRKYAFLMKITFLTLMYGFGSPVIWVFTMLTIVVSYVSEKIGIYWHEKKPPLFDDHLSNNAVFILKWATLFWCGIGFW